MTLSHSFNLRIGKLVDTYRGDVPLARCLLETLRVGPSAPTLTLFIDDEGDTFLRVDFADGSEVILAVTEEF